MPTTFPSGHDPDDRRHSGGSLLSANAQRIRRGSMPENQVQVLAAGARLAAAKLARIAETEPHTHALRRSTLADVVDIQAFAQRLSRSTECVPPLIHPGRDSTLQLVCRQHKTRLRVLDSYRKVKNAMKEMQDRYVASKDQRNPLARYGQLKQMIKEVIVLEKRPWMLVELPKHDISESPNDYVNRVMTHLEDTPADSRAAGGGISSLMGSAAALAEKAKEAQLLEGLRAKSTDELKKEGEKLQTDIFKLTRKYAALRVLLSELYAGYRATKNYPVVPRYSILKTLIKTVLRAPAFAEVCHEHEE